MKALLLLLVFVTACKASTTNEPATCDTAAENMIKVCDPFSGEDFRAACELDGTFLVGQSVRDCVASMSTCDEAAFEACHVRSVILTCAQAEDCTAPFSCDIGAQACVRCMTDADCAPGRGCLTGLCFDMDADYYDTLRAAFAPDAGAMGN